MIVTFDCGIHETKVSDRGRGREGKKRDTASASVQIFKKFSSNHLYTKSIYSKQKKTVLYKNVKFKVTNE